MIIWEEQWNGEGGWGFEGGRQWGGEGLAASTCLLLEYIYGVFIFHLQLRGQRKKWGNTNNSTHRIVLGVNLSHFKHFKIVIDFKDIVY